MPTLASHPVPVAHRTDGRASRQRAAWFWAVLAVLIGATAFVAAPLRAATPTRLPVIEALAPPAAAGPVAPRVPVADEPPSVAPPEPWTCALAFTGLAALVSCARIVSRPSSFQ